MTLNISHYFCFCLPARFGVFLLSVLQLIIGSGAAAMAWFEYTRPDELGAIPAATKGSAAAAGTAYAVLAVCSFFGLVSAMSKKRLLLRVYGCVLSALIAITLGITVWFVVSLYTTAGEQLLRCMMDPDNVRTALLKSSHDADIDATVHDQAVREFCSSLNAVTRGVNVLVMTVALLVEIYAAFMVYVFIKQLNEDKTPVSKNQVSYPFAMDEQPLSKAYKVLGRIV
ncbi:hypothetical protein BKA62DRAFT_832885 [Auriculariales sp. MPI-PUGE-AT-0066]|nr:hypothetical protein BKA62DRAFT_832885 [Auriculariales sp. MPI-PUGE-AT-0066]